MCELGKFPLVSSFPAAIVVPWSNLTVYKSPLLPGTCHSTVLKLLPLSVGSLHLEAIRLVDMNTNETTDIRDLPDIIATDRKEIS